MSITEHLNRIVSKCLELLAIEEAVSPTIIRNLSAIAVLRSTIAAIEFLHGTRLYNGQLAADIIAAWPEELL